MPYGFRNQTQEYEANEAMKNATTSAKMMNFVLGLLLRPTQLT
jgi:hypothetical protein